MLLSVLRTSWGRFIPVVLALGAVIVLVLHFSGSGLGQIRDGERIAVASSRGEAVLEVDEASELSLYVCVPENEEKRLPKSLIIYDGMSGERVDIEALGPRRMAFPAELSKKYAYAQELACVSGNTEYEHLIVEGHVQVDVPAGALVIAALSNQFGSGLSLYRGVFFAFLILLWLSLVNFNECTRERRVMNKKYDGVLGFMMALGLSFLISEGLLACLPSSETLFPDFWEFMILFSSNLLAFVGVYFGIRWFRSRKGAWNTSASDVVCAEGNGVETSGEGCEETSQRCSRCFSGKQYLIPFFGGMGLAIVAAFLTSFAPLPGITSIEMASQLPSTLYISSIFAVLAGVYEELLFRGLIQGSLEARPDSKHVLLVNAGAIAFATSLFVLVHVPQSMEHLWALIPIAAVSILSGCLKIRFRTIYPCILLHTTYNATLVLPSILI